MRPLIPKVPRARTEPSRGHLPIAADPFGISGLTAAWKATELVAQSLAGVVYRSGVAELPPVSAPGSYCEDVGSAVAALASLLGLLHVRAGGRGEVIDVSAILALAHCTDMSLPIWSLLRYESPRGGAGLYPLFECTDGLARLVLPMSPAEWRSLIVWLGSPPEWTGGAWEKAMLGPDERAQIMARLPERFADGTRAELAAAGDAAGVKVTPVLTPAEVLSNEHVLARATFAEIAWETTERRGVLPTGLFGVDGHRAATVTAPRTPACRLAGSRDPPPLRGTDSKTLPLQGIRVLEVGSGVAAPEGGAGPQRVGRRRHQGGKPPPARLPTHGDGR